MITDPVTVGELKARITEAGLEDDDLVVVVLPEFFRNSKEDDGERLPAGVTAVKGFGEESSLRILLE